MIKVRNTTLPSIETIYNDTYDGSIEYNSILQTRQEVHIFIHAQVVDQTIKI